MTRNKDGNAGNKPVDNDKADTTPSLPNERDVRPEANAPRPREPIRQAAEDLKQGQVDTDQHGERGIDQAVNPENVIDTPKSPHDQGGKR